MSRESSIKLYFEYESEKPSTDFLRYQQNLYHEAVVGISAIEPYFCSVTWRIQIVRFDDFIKKSENTMES